MKAKLLCYIGYREFIPCSILEVASVSALILISSIACSLKPAELFACTKQVTSESSENRQNITQEDLCSLALTVLVRVLDTL